MRFTPSLFSAIALNRSRRLSFMAFALLFTVIARAVIDPALQMQTGNPSNATVDANNHTHYLITRAQYAMDFNDTTHQANWVAWDYTSTDSGSAGRSSVFFQDTTLPAGFYQVLTTDYSGSGYDRGHMSPSADRTATRADNDATFFMSNMVPQSPDNNQGVWASFENYTRSLAAAGNEILIISGPSVFGGSTIASGVAIPGYTWKIAVVVPLGPGTALSRIDANMRIIAVKMPNVNGIRSNPWTDYVVSTSEIESDTGFRFFTNLPASVADALRVKIDNAGTSGTAPIITTQPAAQTVLVGTTATFSVGAAGSALTYQWRKDGDEIAGATNPTLTLTNVQATDAAGYDVVVSNANGAVTSAVATLTISSPSAPSITTQPSNQSVTAGGTATFTVVATGLPAPTYQWNKVGTGAISGATSATLTLTNVQATDSNSNYTVTVTNSAGNVTSNPATLTVQSIPPSITTQPTSASVSIGGSVTFTVAATGSAPLTYQWRKNGAVISGATSTSLNLSSIQNADGGSYDVLVTNFAGSTASNIAVLTVTTGGTTSTATQVLYAGGTYTQNFDTLPTTANLTMSGPGPFYFAAPPVIASGLGGWSFASVAIPATNALSTGALGTATELFKADTGTTTAGSMYSYGSAGLPDRALGELLSGSLTSGFGVTLVNSTGQTVTQFTVAFTGEQWRYGGGTGPDKLAFQYQVGGSDIVTGTFTTVAGLEFDSPITSGTGALNGNFAANRRALTATISNVSWAAGQTLVLRWEDFNISGSDDGLAVDDFAFSTLVGGSVPTVAVSSTTPTANATNVGVSTPITVVFNQAVNVTGSWFTITSAANGNVAATVNASADAKTFTLTPTAGFSYGDAITVTLNAAQISDQGTSTTHPTGNYTFGFTTAAPTAPAITTQPSSQAVIVGGSAIFSVNATGTTPLSYQWRKGEVALVNGGTVSGATSSTLTLNGVSLSDAGSYDVVVNNVTNNPATSSPATLTVSTTPVPPSIVTQPQAQSVALGGTATFSVAANGTTPFTYQWFKDGTIISGATSTTLTLSNVTYLSTGNYTVVVTNSAGNATSNPAALVVNTTAGTSVLYYTGSTYAQNFNTLPASGSFNFAASGPYALDAAVANGGVGASGLTGWSFARYSGTGASALFNVDTGSGNSGTAASYGSSGATDRALGSLASGSVVSRFGVTIVNATNQTITQLTLGYAGEQWRKGGSNVANTLTLAYALGATDVNTGTFTDVAALSFSSPIVTTTSGALDGNAYANRTVVGGQLTGLNWGPGQVLVLRWSDVNDTGSDDGLAIDDLTLTTTAPVAPVVSTQPQSQTISVGNSVTFTVAASGTPASSYQWRKDGAVIAGATSTSLTLNNVTTAAAGNYDCLVTNGIGAPVASALALLGVNKAPATVTLGSLTATYDGTPKSATATTTPSGLNVAFTYDGSATAPTNAGTYALVATIVDANYTGSTSGSFTITPATAIVTLGNLSTIYNTAPQSATAMTSPANLPVAFTYDGSATPPTNAGSYAVVATVTDPNYTGSATGTLTIAKLGASVVLSNLSQTYNTATHVATVTTSPTPLAVSVTYDGGSVLPINAGSYAVVATVNENNYFGAATGTLTIAKATAPIALSGLSVVYDGAAKSAVATTTPAGLSVVITYDGNATAPTNAGSYAVAATINEANYIGSATGTLVIAKAPATVALAGLAATYDGTPRIVTATTAPTTGLAVTLTYDGNATAPTSAGSYAVAATVTDPNYSGSATGTLVVAKATATIAFSNTAQTYDGSAKSVTLVTNPTGLTTTLTYGGSASAPTNAGSYALVATIVDSNYAGSATDTLVIAKAAATIALTNTAQTYDGTPKSVTVTTTPAVLSYSLTYDGSATAPTNAGSYALAAAITDPNYAGSTTGTLTIAQAPQTITFNPVSGVTFGDAPFTVSATSGSGLAVAFSIVSGPATIVGNTVTITGAGPVIVRAAQAGNTNYSAAANVDQSFTVGKANQAIAFNPIMGVTFGDVPFTVSATSNAGLAVNFSVVSGPATISGSTVTITGAGPVVVRASQPGDANYNPAPNVDQTFTVGKANQAITFAALADKVYGNAPFTVSATSSSGLPVTFSVANGPATIAGNTVTLTGAGTVIVRASQAGDDNTNAAPNVDRTFAVAKAALTVTAQNATRTYGVANPALAVTYSGFVGADTAASLGTAPTATTVATATTGVGTYAITPAGGVDASYTFTYVAGTLTITPAAATIALTNLGVTYTGAPQSAVATTTPAGIAVALTYNGSATAPTNVGAYAVAATIADPNYTGSTSGSLAIDKAVAPVVLSNLTQTFDGTPKSVAATTTPAGLTVNVTYNSSATAPSAAGSYAVVASISDANYRGSSSGTLVIGTANAAIVLSNLTQVYDGTPKSVTATTAPAGLATSITYNGSATAPTIPGTYAVVATITNPNYTATASGNLAITITALVRHAPTLDGDLDGSLQVLTGENLTLNGNASVSGDILAPGIPTVRLNGHPTFVGTKDGTGSTSPSNYQVTLNGNAVLRYLVRRTDPIAMPVVSAPPAPTGTRDVEITKAGQSLGTLSTLRNITINDKAGDVALPAGTYGTLTADGSTAFVLGTAGATTPSVYNLQGLKMDGKSRLKIVGPVVIVLAKSASLDGEVVSSGSPAWLTLGVASGGLTLNGNVSFRGTIVAPTGTVIINGNASLTGSVIADRLTINGNGLLKQGTP